MQIKYLRFEHRFGRVLAFAQLFDGDRRVMGDTPLSYVLAEAQKSGVTIENSQDILMNLVLHGGFAS